MPFNKIGLLLLAGSGGLATLALTQMFADFSWLAQVGLALAMALGAAGAALWLIGRYFGADAAPIGHVTLNSAARWLYRRGNEQFRKDVAAFVPKLFPTRIVYCERLIQFAAESGVGKIWSRPEADVPHEVADRKRLEEARRSELLGQPPRPLIDPYLSWSDVRKVERHYRDHPETI